MLSRVAGMVFVGFRSQLNDLLMPVVPVISCSMVCLSIFVLGCCSMGNSVLFVKDQLFVVRE